MLYWFASQQKTSAAKRHKCDLFYLEFNGKINKFSVKIQSGRNDRKKVAERQKVAETTSNKKPAKKSLNMWHS